MVKTLSCLKVDILTLEATIYLRYPQILHASSHAMGINRHRLAADHSDPSRPRKWADNREFKPIERYGEKVDLDDVEASDDDGDWTYVACENDGPCESCGRLSGHTDCIIIAIDGACRKNGTKEARAAAGVFVGDKSEYNKSVLLTGSRPTNQVAELSAGILGLEEAIKIRREGIGGGDLHQVVIKTDSKYLVEGMTEWVFKWEKNGYRTSKGTVVTNSGLFKRLEELAGKLRELNVEVLFWHVPRELNRQADELANIALQK